MAGTHLQPSLMFKRGGTLNSSPPRSRVRSLAQHIFRMGRNSVSATTLSITTFNIMKFSIKGLYVILSVTVSIYDTQNNIAVPLC